MQQTSTEVLVVTNWKYDSFPVGSSGVMRGVKPFVKEWVERQNQAIVGYFADQVRLRVDKFFVSFGGSPCSSIIKLSFSLSFYGCAVRIYFQCYYRVQRSKSAITGIEPKGPEISCINGLSRATSQHFETVKSAD